MGWESVDLTTSLEVIVVQTTSRPADGSARDHGCVVSWARLTCRSEAWKHMWSLLRGLRR